MVRRGGIASSGGCGRGKIAGVGRLTAGTVCMVLAMGAFSSATFGQSNQSRDVLGGGDSVKITVFQNPDFTTQARITERGTITFPLLGEVPIAGLTTAGAAARIAQLLVHGKYVRNPQVSLNVVQVRSRQVSVLGQVVRPGRYAIDDTNLKLTDVLALAGGVAPDGDDNVTVLEHRSGKVQRITVDLAQLYRIGNLSQDVVLQGGDEIYVPRAPVFYIYGEVNRAGAYRLQPGMTVMQALSVGGGVTLRGTERGLEIRRKSPDATLRRIQARATDQIEPDDVIYVKESLF